MKTTGTCKGSVSVWLVCFWRSFDAKDFISRLPKHTEHDAGEAESESRGDKDVFATSMIKAEAAKHASHS